MDEQKKLTPAQEETLKRREALRAAYKSVFDSPNGQVVLKDLMRHFGFLETGVEKASAFVGSCSEEVWHRDGTKEPIRRILWLTDANFFQKE